MPPRPTRRLPYPVRPAQEHDLCLNGHRLDLAGRNYSYSPELWLRLGACNLCCELMLPRSMWAEVPLLFAHEEPEQNHARLLLTARPPSTAAGVGRIVLELNDEAIADIDVQMCGVDRRGVIEQVRVADDCRRLRVGTLMVAMALARGRGFEWSTTEVEQTVRARAFWAALRVDVSLKVGKPTYCGHMLDASGREP